MAAGPGDDIGGGIDPPVVDDEDADGQFGLLGLLEECGERTPDTSSPRSEPV